MSDVYFYSPRGKCGFLANFSRHPIVVDGEAWKTVEHYFQAQKFVDKPEIMNMIKAARNPADAKALARKYKDSRRRDWAQVKERVMRSAVQAKFTQHPELREKLLETGNATILERAPDDAYWGTGPSGDGLNRMGRILMELRDHLALRDRMSVGSIGAGAMEA